MSTDINLVEYKEKRDEAEKLYTATKKVYSPALQADIIFNAEGLHHLRYDGVHGKERDKRVQLNKFRFLKASIEIIKKSTTIQEYRRAFCPIGKTDNKGFRKTKLCHWFCFFAIINFTKSIRIRVVVRRVGEGQYHFWSVIPDWSLTNNTRIIGSKMIENE